MAVDPSSLQRVPLFQGIAGEDLSWLLPLLHPRTFPAGAEIMTAEQTAEAVYVLLRGTVRIYIDREDGTEVILALLGPGDVVGEMSLVDSAGRSANVVAMERCSFLWMDRDSFNEALRHVAKLSYNLLQVLTQRLRLANEQILSLSTLDVIGRVARQLLAFAERYGEGGEGSGIRIPLRLTQSNLAELVGASRERVNRVMVKLKESGVVSVDSRLRITVQDRNALAQHCR